MRLSLASSAALLTAGLVASCAPTPKTVAPAPQAAAPAPATRSCVDLARISEARVISDRVIDFHMRDGTILKNTLPHACPSLGVEKAFTYSTSIQRLCSTDIITVIHTGGGPRTGASCGLGSFAAATPVPAPTK